LLLQFNFHFTPSFFPFDAEMVTRIDSKIKKPSQTCYYTDVSLKRRFRVEMFSEVELRRGLNIDRFELFLLILGLLIVVFSFFETETERDNRNDKQNKG